VGSFGDARVEGISALIIEPGAESVRIERLERSLSLLDGATREPQTFLDDDPVFVASIGWRSGSTLMQRAVMTDPSILVWGEPLAHLLYLNRLAEPLFGISEDWPQASHWLSHRPKVDLTRDWVATLSPDAGHLKAAYRAFLDSWMAVPARQRGFKRWGVKQVRWTGEDAVVLRWLYPRCKFLVVVRHPVSAYQSMRNFGFDPPAYGHLVKWPDQWVASLDDYAQFWNALALSWGAVIDKLGATWVRYEDFVDGRVDLNPIGASFGLNLQAEVARSAKVGGSTYQTMISPAEREQINELTAPGRQLFSYLE
jgi:Sulfotransferase family